MPQISNFAEARHQLNQFVQREPGETGYSLDRMSKLMKELGNPQDNLKIIHVAGTSGKTSTCYYIAALLHAAGKKVGLTVSPHVDEVNERVQISLTPLSEPVFCQKLGKFIEVVNEKGLEPSYFELLVAFAYWIFAQEKVDYAVIEVGLGGLLDGTNVIHRPDKVCVITDIGLDHTQVLGNTLAKIAAQKAGIIQDHNPVFMYSQGSEVMEPIIERCKHMHAQLHQIGKPDEDLYNELPPFQQRNYHLAQSVFDFVAQSSDLTKLNDSQKSKAAHTLIPARMEVLKRSGKTIIIDGSHNAQKMEAVVAGVHKLYKGQPVAALVGFVDSEQERAAGALEKLHLLTESLIVTSFSGEQDTPKFSVNPKDIANTANEVGFKHVTIVTEPEVAFAKLLMRSEPVLLVTGSFYLLNHIRPLVF
ncbi:MAG TPA: cyanophycin synthetase [Patescibacteria group bacterium]|nr:cyanophycin synthetase [Patescibacteria group bacterium]